jgi:ankyrin repeat protein
MSSLARYGYSNLSMASIFSLNADRKLTLPYLTFPDQLLFRNSARMSCFRRNFQPHFRREHALNLAELVYHSMGVGDRALTEQRVAYAIRQGSNPNTRDYTGMVALHHACALEDWPEMVTMLMTAERVPPVPPTAVSLEAVETGHTPLHVAVHHSNIGCVEMLLKYGADQTIKDNDGNLARDLARENEDKEILALLDAHATPLDAMQSLNATRDARAAAERARATSWWVLQLPVTKPAAWVCDGSDTSEFDADDLAARNNNSLGSPRRKSPRTTNRKLKKIRYGTGTNVQ